MHDYYLLAVLEIFLESNNYNQINIISHQIKFNRIKNNLSQLEKHNCLIKQFNLKSPNGKILEVLSKLRLNKLISIPVRIFNLMGLVYWLVILNNRKNDFFITEIQDRINPRLLNILMPKKTVSQIKYLTLHNIDRFFEVETQVNILFNEFNKIVVLSEKLKQKIQNIYNNKNVSVFPAATPTKKTVKLREKSLETIRNDVIQFCVTGSVDEKRKDYRSIIKLFKDIQKTSYRLIFLGKLKSQWVKDEAIKNSLNVIFYDDFVSDDEFTKQIINSHFLITMNDSKNYFNYKISGIMYDAVRYGLPLLSNNSSFQHSNLINLLLNETATLKEVIEHSQSNYYNAYGKQSLELSKKALPNNLINTLNLFQNKEARGEHT